MAETDETRQPETEIDSVAEYRHIAQLVEKIISSIETVIYGKRDVIELAILAMLARGHLLLEDVPGTGKTTLARALARAFSGSSGRIQFTPDLLPSDITGANFYDARKNEFVFRPGPIFCQVFLADEINRGTPRTQSSLLECMQECNVTIDGVTRELPEPFFVLATQNPTEFQGTYPLPEAQLDRFTMRIAMGYPSLQAEAAAVLGQLVNEPMAELRPVASAEDIVAMRQQVGKVFVAPKMMEYILELVDSTRRDSRLRLGASPRGSVCLTRSAQASAAVDGRDFITPYDVKRLAVPVLSHRVLLAPEAVADGMDAREIIGNLVDLAPVPAMRQVSIRTTIAELKKEEAD